jgi:hypothetical protein
MRGFRSITNPNPGVARKVPEVRRVIGGLSYDTNTASVQYHDCAADDPRDPGYGDDIGSVLFLNKWNAYFVLNYNYCLDPWDAGYEEIKPLTLPEAVSWGERHCAHLVEALFGEMPEAGQGQPYQPVKP